MSAWLTESGASLRSEARVKTYICGAFTSLLPELSFLLNCLVYGCSVYLYSG